MPTLSQTACTHSNVLNYQAEHHDNIQPRGRLVRPGHSVEGLVSEQKGLHISGVAPHSHYRIAHVQIQAKAFARFSLCPIERLRFGHI